MHAAGPHMDSSRDRKHCMGSLAQGSETGSPKPEPVLRTLTGKTPEADLVFLSWCWPEWSQQLRYKYILVFYKYI